ncbi:MAG: hypothetical protein AAB462_00675 [Patescibacteria group bacterium]
MAEGIRDTVGSFLRGPDDEGHTPEVELASAGAGEIVTEAPISTEAKIGQKAIQAPDPQSPDDRMFILSRGGREIRINPFYI